MGIDIAADREAVKEKTQKRTLSPVIDCWACKAPGSMKPARIKRFTGMVYMTGQIITIPAILAFVAVLVALPFNNLPWVTKISMVMGVFCVSAVMGLVGWLLISKRPVFLCQQCGFVIDRTTE